MATTQNLKNQLTNKKSTSVSNNVQGTTLKALLASPAVAKRFDEVLGKKSNQFAASILNLYNSEAMLQKSEPMSVISSAMIAATLDLPIDKNLGYAWIVPYAGKAQFQLGYKGYIQLALRSGQYKNINVTAIHEGELVSWNPLTEEIEIDFELKKSEKIIGYAAYFELLNGFRKTIYWTKEQIETHKSKFSKSDFGWKKDWDAMAQKTVLKALLSKWGILSIDMQKAYSTDEQNVKLDMENSNNDFIIEAEEVEIVENDKTSLVDENGEILFNE